MAYSVADIKEDVRTILDRNEVTTSIESLESDVDTLSLDDIIEKEIVPAARQVEMIAPREYVDWSSVDGGTLSAADNLYTVTLPSKFLRFGRAKLSSWSHALAEFVTTDSKEYKRQWYGVAGLQATGINPLIALVEGTGDGNQLQMFGGVTSSTTLDYCTVCVEPSVTDDALQIGDGLKAPYLYVLAALVAQDLKDDNKASVMMQTCKNMLSADTGNVGSVDAATQATMAQQ